jgi:hypothetical protein
MPNHPTSRRHLIRALAAIAAAALPLAQPIPAQAALKSAAGASSGSGGFANVVSYADKLATDLIPLAVPLAVLGAIVCGFMYMGGKPEAQSWAVRVAIGFIVVVAAKGIIS